MGALRAGTCPRTVCCHSPGTLSFLLKARWTRAEASGLVIEGPCSPLPSCTSVSEVVVEYDYDALHEDELTLRSGDVIKNVHYVEEDGWMEGDLNGKRGLFPDNFVKEARKESKEVKETKSEPKEEASQPQRRDKSAGNVAHLVQRMSTIGIPTGGFLPQPPAASKKPKRRKCKVLFDYQPQNEDELLLKIGDVVDIIEEVEEGWWNGNFNGKSGLFPSNFVKELDGTGEDGDTSEGAADESDGSGMESGGAPPTSPQPAAGNGAIAQPKKIRGVGFGDIFREGSVKLKARLPSAESEEKKEKPIPSLPSAAKPAHPNMTESQRADGDGKSKAKEYCKVTFAFEATNEDELTIKEGDVIHILSKDTGEPGWWRGDIGGRDGVFPDNFVVLVSEAEKETPPSRGSLRSPPKQDPEEPKKPPPPSKSTALRPEAASADKRLHPLRPEDRVDRPAPDPKPSKPAAPMVPPKKPVAPPGKGRPGGFLPKRPDKPLAPSPNLKHNGEVPSARPKSDLELLLPTKAKTLSEELGQKSSDTDLMSFDEMSSTSEKLSHPTANRPKMPGRRLPAQFGGGLSPTKEVSVEKCFKLDDVDAAAAKPKLTETRKPSTDASPQTAPPIGPDCTGGEASAGAGAWPGPGSVSAPLGADGELHELRIQMKQLLASVELLKAQQTKEIAALRGELDEERLKRIALQMEIDKLKRTVHST
ncbi:CD2-associated protein isoform 3-T3 [Spinachia spinachia]